MHYFVDFTEEDFVDRLINEINKKSNITLTKKEPKKLDENIIKKISLIYNKKENEIDFSKRFKLKELYPKVFDKKLLKDKKRVKIEKHSELKKPLEKINNKIILKNEKEFEDLIYNFFIKENDKFTKNSISFESKTIQIEKNNKAYSITKEIKNDAISFKSMSYKDFLIQTAVECKINIQTLHNVFVKLKRENILNINNYLNQSSIRTIKREFDNLMKKINLTI